MFKNNDKKYGLITKFFHWVIGFGIIYLLYLGFTMKKMESSPEKWAEYASHREIGMLILLATVIFYIWKLFNKSPKEIETMSIYQKLASKIVKFSLLLIMLLYPLTGYIMSAGGGYTIDFFGLFDVPLVIEKGAEWFGFSVGKTAHAIHGYLLPVTIVLIAMHALGALFHHFIQKDDVLKRMTTGIKD